MTLKEFLEKNPAAVEEAAKCTTLEEFKALAEGKGLSLSSSDEWKDAFAFVKSQSEGELGDDALGSVSGGTMVYQKEQVFSNSKGEVTLVGEGEKR